MKLEEMESLEFESSTWRVETSGVRSWKNQKINPYFIFSDDDKSKNLIKCEECGLTCAGRSHYNVHIRSHTGERPYICHICGFGFTQKENVPNHLT